MFDAWTLFCRKQDSENLDSPSDYFSELADDDEQNVNDDASDTRIKEEKCKETATAAKLGQYFVSDENAKDVSTFVLSMDFLASFTVLE